MGRLCVRLDTIHGQRQGSGGNMAGPDKRASVRSMMDDAARWSRTQRACMGRRQDEWTFRRLLHNAR